MNATASILSIIYRQPVGKWKTPSSSVPSLPLSAANVSKRTAKILSQLRQTFGRRTTKECWSSLNS